MDLTADERAMAEGAAGEAAAMAMRIVAETGRIMGAARLVPITSAHIDGCLYHGDSGVEFAETLVERGGKVAVPATLNVGALDLAHPEIVRGPARDREMARRQMNALSEARLCSELGPARPIRRAIARRSASTSPGARATRSPS